MTNILRKQIYILEEYFKKNHNHPGAFLNTQFFWPKFIGEKTNNVYILSTALVYEYPLNRLYLNDYIEYGVEKYYHFPIDKFKTYIDVSQPKKRFLFINFILVDTPRNSAHANGLLYDFETGIMERYDPHGFASTLTYAKLTGPILRKRIKTHLEKSLGISIKRFVNPSSVRTKNSNGFQLLQAWNEKMYNNFNNECGIYGYCAAWTFYILYMRVQFPNIKGKDIIKFFKKRYKGKMDRIIHEFYFDFMRYKQNLITNSIEI